MRKFVLMLTAMAFVFASCAPKQETMRELSDRVFAVAMEQYQMMDAQLAPDQFPKTFEDDSLITTGLKWWCSGFPAGTMWYIYEYTRDPQMLELAKKHTAKMSAILDYPTHHDIGFQINDSYGQAYRLTGDEAYLPLIKAAAERLAGRFSPVTGVTMSWEPSAKWNYPVIIDNMMNLELLENASKLFDEPGFDAVARTHANTTMANHFRPDYTVYHLLDYDPENGDVVVRQTVQGYADETCWSRGEAWALYGYTMMYRETGDEAYLALAEHIADYLLTVLPEDGIPYWDFNAPGTPNAIGSDAVGAPEYDYDESLPVKRDASAGAIIASALVDLSRLTKDADKSASYIAEAEKMLRTFAGEEYLAKSGELGGFVLKHSVGNLHGSKKGPTEVDVPLTYADYYFLEALVKFNEK